MSFHHRCQQKNKKKIELRREKKKNQTEIVKVDENLKKGKLVDCKKEKA